MTTQKKAQVTVKVSGSGTAEAPFHVDLPTYSMVPGTEKYSDPGHKVLVAVEVKVPADEVDDKGNLKEKHIRKKYREGWTRFKASRVKPRSRGEKK